MEQTPQPPTHAVPTGPRRVTQTGCALIVLGGVLFIISLIMRASSGVTSEVKLIAMLGAGIGFGGVLITAIAGKVMTMKARHAISSLDDFPDIDADREAVRQLESNRLKAIAMSTVFPSAVAASKLVRSKDHSTFYLVNLPSLKRSPGQPMEVAAAYHWVYLDTALPRLMLTLDAPKQRHLVGADFDIENEEFNRRYRVDSDLPGPGGRNKTSVAYDEFVRYASAVLHPLAVEILLLLPRGYTFHIDGEILVVIGPPVPDEDMIRSVGEVLVTFAEHIPEHVEQRWGGQETYLPRDDRESD